MDDVRGDFLGPPHGTTPAAVIANKEKLRSKPQQETIICTMDDVRGDFLGPPHGTTPAAVIANKKTEIKGPTGKYNLHYG